MHTYIKKQNQIGEFYYVVGHWVGEKFIEQQYFPCHDYAATYVNYLNGGLGVPMRLMEEPEDFFDYLEGSDLNILFKSILLSNIGKPTYFTKNKLEP